MTILSAVHHSRFGTIRGGAPPISNGRRTYQKVTLILILILTLTRSLRQRLCATDLLTCTEPPVLKGLDLRDRQEAEAEQRKLEQAQRDAEQQAEWEKSFKQLYPTTEQQPAPSAAGSWAALAKKSDPPPGPWGGDSKSSVPPGPPDLSGPSLSEAYRKPSQNKGAGAGPSAWGGSTKSQPQVQRQVWETQPPSSSSLNDAIQTSSWERNEPKPSLETPIWETQPNSTVENEPPRDLVAELAASMGRAPPGSNSSAQESTTKDPIVMDESPQVIRP